MKILDKAVALEKALLRRFGRRTDIARHPIEICRAVLDDIEDASEPGSDGARIFPYQHIAISVAVGGDHQRATAEAVFEEPPGFEARVRSRLQQRGCRVSDPLTVGIKFVDGNADAWRGREYGIEYRRRPVRRDAEKRTPAALPASVPQELHLAVVSGSAVKQRYVFSSERINLGRLNDVLDRHDRVVRQNQVVFADGDDGISQSVSRAHAHIRFDALRGDAHLHDDGSTRGTRVARDGRAIDVPRSARGIKLRDGDEIVLGLARLRVSLQSRSPARTKA